MDKNPLTVAYLFTTFPKPTETFLQREIAAMQAFGVNLKIYSLHRGGGTYRAVPCKKFSKWELFKLIWALPYESYRRPDILWLLILNVIRRRPPSWLQFWENMLGAGFGCIYAREFRKNRVDLVHAAWAGAPATAAWLFARIAGTNGYGLGAHAYDLYEHGGDWWLMEKVEAAHFVHTSTEMGRKMMVQRGGDGEKIHCIRRGLETFPLFKPLRMDRSPIRIVCVARLVPKKGLFHQMRIYGALRDAGIDFEARIVGDGKLRGELMRLARELGVEDRIIFLGHLPQIDVFAELDWADVLVHTGVVAPSGDRDGLPNVIPEAMSAGVIVITSPIAATTEAVHHEETGLVADVTQPKEWVSAVARLRDDDVLSEKLRIAGRAWVEANFDAKKNAARLLALMKEAAKR